MLALAIEFSRCSEARTPRAEQCARQTPSRSPIAFHFPRRPAPKDVLANGSSELACRVASAPTWSLPAVGTNARQDRSAKWLLRKEVIQPHLTVRLPCYDFTPIASPTFDGSLHKGWATGFGCCPLSWCDGRCVQGPGTYSPQHC